MGVDTYYGAARRQLLLQQYCETNHIDLEKLMKSVKSGQYVLKYHRNA